MPLCFKRLLLFGMIFCFVKLSAQNEADIFKNAEDSIQLYFKNNVRSRSDHEKVTGNKCILRLFESVLVDPASFHYPFDSLKTVGFLNAPDKSFRIFTWNIAYENGTFGYFGYIQYFSGKEKTYHYIKLTEKTDAITDPENTVLSAARWYGGLYYKIVKHQVDDKSYYTLLALQLHDQLVTRKFIDILYFDAWNNPVFGAPLFKTEAKQLKHRILFQYAAGISMNLRYDEKLGMIIFDHLSPNESRYSNDYTYYGPDLSVDGFRFVKGIWELQKNIDLRNPAKSRR